jgi:hypothetical protein
MTEIRLAIRQELERLTEQLNEDGLEKCLFEAIWGAQKQGITIPSGTYLFAADIADKKNYGDEKFVCYLNQAGMSSEQILNEMCKREKQDVAARYARDWGYPDIQMTCYLHILKVILGRGDEPFADSFAQSHNVPEAALRRLKYEADGEKRMQEKNK